MKNLKTNLLVTSVLLGSLTNLGVAFASDAAANRSGDIPVDAALFLQAQGSDELGQNETPATSKVVNAALSDALAKEAEANVEFNCQAVYRQWAVTTEQEDGGDGLGFQACGLVGHLLFDSTGRCYHTKTVTINEYCVKRTLVQQQIISLSKACQQDPKPECFSKDYLDYLTKLQPTTYVDIDKPQD
jgi:hypothetical protein